MYGNHCCRPDDDSATFTLVLTRCCNVWRTLQSVDLPSWICRDPYFLSRVHGDESLSTLPNWSEDNSIQGWESFVFCAWIIERIAMSTINVINVVIFVYSLVVTVSTVSLNFHTEHYHFVLHARKYARAPVAMRFRCDCSSPRDSRTVSALHAFVSREFELGSISETIAAAPVPQPISEELVIFAWSDIKRDIHQISFVCSKYFFHASFSVSAFVMIASTLKRIGLCNLKRPVLLTMSVTCMDNSVNKLLIFIFRLFTVKNRLKWISLTQK